MYEVTFAQYYYWLYFIYIYCNNYIIYSKCSYKNAKEEHIFLLPIPSPNGALVNQDTER